MRVGFSIIGFCASFLVLLPCSWTAFASDWPQFQGPDRNGHSPETGLARTWPENGPKELWTVSVGPGYGGPAVRDGEVYFLDRVDEQQDILRCLDLNTGEEKWRYAYDAPGSTGHSGSRTTPTVDTDFVYTVGLMGDFLCVDRKSHQPVWRKNLLKDHGLEAPSWGVSQSPSLYKNWVIVAPQAPNAFVAAYDRRTGAPVWGSPGLGGVGYSTPVIISLCGVDQAVMISGSEDRGGGRVAGVSLEDGKILWSYDGWQCKIPIPYAFAVPGDRLFITGGYKAGSVMLQIQRNNGAFEARELYRLDMNTCGSQIHQPILYKDHLYVNSNSNEREDGMICLSLEGKVMWRTKDIKGLPTFERGNLLLADDMLIALDGKKGKLHLIDPMPEGYKERASAQVLSGSKMWSPMALSQGKLLVRSQSEMKCLDLRNP